MTDDRVWLRLQFRGFYFTFVDTHLEIEDRVHRRAWAITFDGPPDSPFVLTPIDHGRSQDAA